jgi:hypothetical protein
MRVVNGQKVETRVKLTDLVRPEDTIIVRSGISNPQREPWPGMDRGRRCR